MKLVCWIINNHQWSDWAVFHWNFNEREGGEERTCKRCNKNEKRRIELKRQVKELYKETTEAIQS
jgi:hypothetical protein